MLISVVMIVIGFILLIKGADFFVDGAVAVAEKLGIPEIVVGLTIVAFGTSAPEAAVSIKSALSGSCGMAVGNVLGSNIMNIFIILGLTALCVKLHIQENTIKIDIPFLIYAAVICPVLGIYLGELNWMVGCLFWVSLILYIAYLIRTALKTEVESKEEEKQLSPIMIILFLLGGAAAIIIGSNVAVEGAKVVATHFGVSDRIIGLTVIAFGTSLPELITSLTAARKGNADIAIGNIVGSNIFNILFILGTTSFVRTIPFGMDYLVDGLLGILAAVLLFLFTLRKKELNRIHGFIFLVIYGVYMYFLIRG